MGELGQSSQPATEADAPGGLRREGAEQRREARYTVHGDAEVVVLGGMSMFRGRVLNLSPSGCYVQTVAWACLAPQTAVEILFVVKGHMVRARAEARFSESKIGLGLRFLTMEEQMRRRLDGIVAALRAAMETAETGRSGQAVHPPLAASTVLSKAELEGAAADRHEFVLQSEAPPVEDPVVRRDVSPVVSPAEGAGRGVELSVSREQRSPLPGEGAQAIGRNGEAPIAALAESAAPLLVAIAGEVVVDGGKTGGFGLAG